LLEPGYGPNVTKSSIQTKNHRSFCGGFSFSGQSFALRNEFPQN